MAPARHMSPSQKTRTIRVMGVDDAIDAIAG